MRIEKLFAVEENYRQPMRLSIKERETLVIQISMGRPQGILCGHWKGPLCADRRGLQDPPAGQLPGRQPPRFSLWGRSGNCGDVYRLCRAARLYSGVVFKCVDVMLLF